MLQSIKVQEVEEHSQVRNTKFDKERQQYLISAVIAAQCACISNAVDISTFASTVSCQNVKSNDGFIDGNDLVTM